MLASRTPLSPAFKNFSEYCVRGCARNTSLLRPACLVLNDQPTNHQFLLFALKYCCVLQLMTSLHIANTALQSRACPGPTELTRVEVAPNCDRSRATYHRIRVELVPDESRISAELPARCGIAVELAQKGAISAGAWQTSHAVARQPVETRPTHTDSGRRWPKIHPELTAATTSAELAQIWSNLEPRMNGRKLQHAATDQILTAENFSRPHPEARLRVQLQDMQPPQTSMFRR